MPTAGSILTSTAEIANELTVIAVAWHGVVAAVLMARLAGWHPSYGRLARLQVLTMTSVSVSWAHMSFGLSGQEVRLGVVAVVARHQRHAGLLQQ